MNICQYVLRNRSLLPTTTVADIFGTKKLRKHILPLVQQYQQNYLLVSQKITTLAMIDEFYHSLYVPFISSKPRSTVYSLPTLIEQGWIKGKIYRLWSVYDGNRLIGGKITSLDRNRQVCTLARTAYDIAYAGVNTYLEYCVFTYAIRKRIPTLSLGVTPNACGSMAGSGPGVALHKIQYGFMPRVSTSAQIMNRSDDMCQDDTLVFCSSVGGYNPKDMLDTVIVYTNMDEGIRGSLYGVLAKRGLTLSYMPYTIETS